MSRDAGASRVIGDTGERPVSGGSAEHHEIVLPEGWPRPRGYSNAIVSRGRVVFVAGQIGWDPAIEEVVEGGIAAQARRALQNVLTLVEAAGGSARDVVRLTWFVTDRDEYRTARNEIGRSYRDLFGSHYPAMSLLVVAGLLEDGAVVEIEATAVLPDASG